MGKLTYKDKISIYKERKSGIGAITLSKKYGIRREKIYYLLYFQSDCQLYSKIFLQLDYW